MGMLGGAQGAAELGEPKISQLEHGLGVKEDVVGLEVAVDDALRVNVCQACQDLPYNLYNAGWSREISFNLTLGNKIST